MKNGLFQLNTIKYNYSPWETQEIWSCVFLSKLTKARKDIEKKKKETVQQVANIILFRFLALSNQ